MSKALRYFSIKDMVLIAAMAAAGIAIKPLVSNLAHLISTPLMMPGGAIAGGLYMMWIVVAYGLTGKRGSMTLTCVVQAILTIITGIGSHGIVSIVSYIAPGVLADLALLLIRHKACCLPCTFTACLIANVTGTLTVNFIYFNMPPVFLMLTLVVAAFSGGVGGILTRWLLLALKKFGIGVITGSEEDDSTDVWEA